MLVSSICHNVVNYYDVGQKKLDTIVIEKQNGRKYISINKKYNLRIYVRHM